MKNVKTCSQCRHWHKLPANPADLSAQIGECREGPPDVEILVMQGPQGIVPVGQICQYPQLPSTFPACGRYAPRLVEQTT